jgi:hypothetical protein
VKILRLQKYVILISALWSALMVAFFVRTNSALQLVAMVASLFYLMALLASVVHLFAKCRKLRWRSLIPLAVCGAAFLFTVRMARVTRDFLFVRSFPNYEAVVHEIESGAIPISSKASRISPAEAQTGAYRVFASRDNKDVLFVEFWTGGGFPVKHSGYLYVSSGVVEPGSFEDSNWPVKRREKAQWFYVSD